MDHKTCRRLALLGLLAAGQAWGATYRWVDDKGRVHYSDTQPANGSVQAMLDREGRVMPQPQAERKAAAAAPKPTQSAEELARQRHDRALLSTYVNEAEIDLARDRAIEHARAKVNSLKVQIENSRQRLLQLNAEIADYKRRQVRVPAPVMQMKNEAQERIVQLSDQLLAVNRTIEELGARYEADKQRFRQLKGLQQ